LPQSGFGWPQPVYFVNGASPLTESTAKVRSGFHAAKFHGKLAHAECPSGTTGVKFNSE
jgi:hypothetical protein